MSLAVKLCVLCVSVLKENGILFSTETQRTQSFTEKFRTPYLVTLSEPLIFQFSITISTTTFAG